MITDNCATKLVEKSMLWNHLYDQVDSQIVSLVVDEKLLIYVKNREIYKQIKIQLIENVYINNVSKPYRTQRKP